MNTNTVVTKWKPGRLLLSATLSADQYITIQFSRKTDVSLPLTDVVDWYIEQVDSEKLQGLTSSVDPRPGFTMASYLSAVTNDDDNYHEQLHGLVSNPGTLRALLLEARSELVGHGHDKCSEIRSMVKEVCF